MENKIILIGGAPTVGKSSIAEKISHELGIPWISTDLIREIMLKTVSRSLYPNLFLDSDYEAEEYYEKFSADEIVNNENLISEAVWNGVMATIKNNHTWKTFIIEGVSVLPSLVVKDLKNMKRVVPIFLIDENEERIRDVIFNRGLWEASKNYPDSVKENEVQYVTLFNKYIRDEAIKYGFTHIEVGKNDEDYRKVMKKLNI